MANLLNSNLLRDGYEILPQVISPPQCVEFTNELERLLNEDALASIGATRGGFVGGRNLIQRWPDWRRLFDRTDVGQLVAEHCGAQAGLVRVLFFDKPPGKSWALSLHRDQTIAVEKHCSPPSPYSKPTRKAGVPHVEANQELLCQMLTLRLHLDPMNDENGPVVVIPGSHWDAEPNQSSPKDSDQQQIEVIHCDAGDLFVMRPLLLHGSRASSPDTRMHRRVIHLEFGPSELLPGDYRWHDFLPV